jgi:hypothetical protein
MSAFLHLSQIAKSELEANGASVNELAQDQAVILAWVERWRADSLEELSAEDWVPVDVTVSFSQGMQAEKTARMRLACLFSDVMPDIKGEVHWVAFTQAISAHFPPLQIEIEPQSHRLLLSIEQLLANGVGPRVLEYVEQLAYVAGAIIPAMMRLRIEAWTVDDARALAGQVLNEALTLGYLQ